MLRFFLILLTIALVYTTVGADPLEERFVLSDNPTPLLGDRLRILMPEGAIVEARAVNIMAAETPLEEETRIVFDQGEKRLVLMTYELFQTAGPGLAEQLAPSCHLIVDRKSLRVYQSDAAPVEFSKDAVLVTTAWAVNTDRTVQLLVGYANPAAAAEIQSVQRLFTQALKSLEPGPKELVTQARLQRLDVYSETSELVARLADGWAYTLQTGPDFLVHRIRQLVPYGTDSTGISLYVGGHPGYFYQKEDVESQKIAGTLLGQAADWFRSSDDGRLRLESIRPLTEVDDDLMLHVFINSPSEEGLRSAQEIVETLAIAGKTREGPSRP